MSKQDLNLPSSQSLSSNVIYSSDSSQEKKEIIDKLQNKVTNLLIIQKKSEKLSQSQDNLKKCIARIEQYKKLNQELQQRQNILCDSLGISPNSDLETIKKSSKDMKSNIYLLNAIHDELNISQDLSQDQSEAILNSIQQLKNINSENNRFISKMLRILGVYNYSSFNANSNEESPSSLLFNEIQKLREENETLKTSVENFTFNQNEICQMLDIDNTNENDSYTLHFRMKGAIKNIKNSLREGMEEFASILSPECRQNCDTPQIVKTAITDLQQSANKLKKELQESEQKYIDVTNQLQNFESKNDKILRKLNCSSIDEIEQNFEDLMTIMNSQNLDILKRAVCQMKDQNKTLQTQTEELNSKIQLLQINNQNLNEQLLTLQDQFACLKSKLNELEAKKTAFKDELKEMKSKLNSIKIELRTVTNERNNLKGQLTDKDEEIITLKDILQTEKGNVKIQFEELEDQILTLKGQIRKSQQETESIRSDYQNLQQTHDSLQQQHKVIKDEKQNLELENEKQKLQIHSLNKEINLKADEIETMKNKNENHKKKIFSQQNQIDELTNDQSNLKRKINDMNIQIDSIQTEKAKLLYQYESEVKENQSLKLKVEENKLKINQLESLNLQQKSEIDSLNQMKNDLIGKNNEFQRQVSQFQLKVADNEQTIQNLKQKIEQLQNDMNSINSEKKLLQSQVTSLKNENSELKSRVFQLEKENQAIKLDCEQKIQKYEIEKIDQFNKNLQKQNDELVQSRNNLKNQFFKNEDSSQNSIETAKFENSEEFDSNIKRSNDQIDEMIENQNHFCKLLGINSNSPATMISDSITELLIDNKKMYKDNQSMKQQLASIASMLNINDPGNLNSIQSTINDLYDELQRNEIEKEKIIFESNGVKQLNRKMCQILNVMSTESLIDAISSVQRTINQIKQILNVSDDHIIECIESLHDSIQTLCDALNIDPKDSWIDTVLSMYEALQDAAELLGITNSNQLSTAIQKILNERDHLSSEMQQVEELQKQSEQFFQQSEEFQQKNDDLNQQLGELNIQNDDLSSQVEILQLKVDNLSQLNEDLKQQNSAFEAESQNGAFLEKQISDICRLLQIKPLMDKNISDSIAEAIESLKKAKDEFIAFKRKVNKLLKSKKTDSFNNSDFENDDNKITAETLREIETLNQLSFNLCRLFNVKSADMLVDAAKKNVSLFNAISPLFDSYGQSYENSDIEDSKKWQMIVQEARQAKQTNDKISSLLGTNGPSEIINSIKSIQNQLSTFQSKDQENTQFVEQLCETLGIDSNKDENGNRNKQIQKVIFEMKENSIDSQKVFDKLSKLFNCEVDYIVDFADLICKTIKSVSETLEIDAASPGSFSSIESSLKELKEQNNSLMKKFNDDKLFAFQFLSDLNMSGEHGDDLVRDVLTKLKEVNSELKKQNEALQNNQDENESLIHELEEKVSAFMANNKKLFDKFDLLSRLDSSDDHQSKSNEAESDSLRLQEIFEKVDELHQTKKEYQKAAKKNKDLSARIRSIEIENVRHANQIRQSRSQIANVDDAIKYMKSFEIQVTKLRQIVGIPDSQFSFVVEKVSQIVDQLSSQNSTNDKLKQELKFSKDRIRDFENNEVEYKKLIDTQENKIDSLTSEMSQKDIAIDHLNSSLNNIFKSVGDGNIRSADFAVDIIEEQKKKMAELENELIELRSAVTVDSAFDKMSTNEKQQLKFIKKKIIEQTDNFNAFLEKLKLQFENRNQNKEEIIQILKDAEADNFRLLDLLDPPLDTLHNSNRYHQIHIGNEYAMNPFAKQDVDIFRKRRRNLECNKEDRNDMFINHKIATSEKELITQRKKIDGTDRKFVNMKRSERQGTLNTISIALAAQRKKKEQTTLF